MTYKKRLYIDSTNFMVFRYFRITPDNGKDIELWGDLNARAWDLGDRARIFDVYGAHKYRDVHNARDFIFSSMKVSGY